MTCVQKGQAPACGDALHQASRRFVIVLDHAGVKDRALLLFGLALCHPDRDLPRDRLSSFLHRLGAIALVAGEDHRREVEAAPAVRAQ